MKIIHMLMLSVVILLAYFSCIYFYLREEPVGTDGISYMRSLRTVLKPPELFDPVDDCATPFGALLGVANNTPAFSNCATAFHGKEVGYYTFADPFDVREPRDYSRKDKVMTGTRWNAIEYVIRWMAFNRGLMPLVLEDVPSMWDKVYFYNPAKHTQEYDAEYIINYNDASTPEEIAYTRPRPGDIIMYSANTELGYPRGHIAVIVAVKNDIEGAGGPQLYTQLARTGKVPHILYLAEQNYDNKAWPQANYSRTARFKWHESTRPGMGAEGYVEDDSGLSVLGRMRVGTARIPRPEVDHYADTLNAQLDEGDL